MMGISNRFPLCGKTQQSERPDKSSGAANGGKLLTGRILFRSRRAKEKRLTLALTVIKKEIHFRLLSLDGKYMLLF